MGDRPAQLSALAAITLSLLTGALLWVGTNLATGRQEAWDASAYWVVTYPLSILSAGMIGYLAPVRAWRWGAGLMAGQAIALVVWRREFGLLPLGLIVFGMLALLPMAAARFGAQRRLPIN